MLFPPKDQTSLFKNSDVFSTVHRDLSLAKLEMLFEFVASVFSLFALRYFIISPNLLFFMQVSFLSLFEYI